MQPAPLPHNETERQRLLSELQILDTLEEQVYDDLTFLAAQICQTPIALVSLVDRERQWFKSRYGLSVRETPREVAFCAHAILGDTVFVVDDSMQDARFRDNPLVTGEPHMRFYAGAPLIMRDNIHVGTICVIDRQAREISPAQRQALEVLARQVVTQLDLRLRLKTLTRLDRIKDDFVSMVNHELRTPLTSINGALTLLKNQVAGELPEQAIQLVDVAYRNGERLLNIVNDILDVSKLEAGKMQMHMKPLGLKALLDRAIKLNHPYCAGFGCQLSLTLPNALTATQVWADEQRIIQVLNNLISNAAKFTHAGDTIEISCCHRHDQIEISVTDHGKGISVEKTASLFKKFQQLNDVPNRKAPGTGLGLSISKQIVEQHHGEIGCESIPNERTRFFFTLPINDPQSA